jgi:hypothetical protein
MNTRLRTDHPGATPNTAPRYEADGDLVQQVLSAIASYKEKVEFIFGKSVRCQ